MICVANATQSTGLSGLIDPDRNHKCTEVRLTSHLLSFKRMDEFPQF